MRRHSRTVEEWIDPWKAAVEDAYKLGVREGQEGIDHCFNPFTDGQGRSIDLNDDRKNAWAKGWEHAQSIF